MKLLFSFGGKEHDETPCFLTQISSTLVSFTIQSQLSFWLIKKYKKSILVFQ